MMNGVSVASQIESLTKHNPFFKSDREHVERFVLRGGQFSGVKKKQEEWMVESRSLLQTVAHELKHPLGMIVSSAGVLQESHKSMPTEELELWLGRIVQRGLEMSHIIDELLLLFSLTEAEVETKPLDMAGIVRKTRQSLVDMIKAYQASIIVPTTWPVAMGYAPWIERVWTNYLSNAMKYGGQPARIELGAARQRDGMVRFWVQDNGPGLSQNEQARLFRPFTRLELGRAEGYGLGLSIVQRIVQALGGCVGVESEGMPGQGCVFFFTLPGCGG